MYKTIAQIYSKSLFDLAIQQDNIDRWRFILSVFSEVSEIDIVKSLFCRCLEPKKLSNIFIDICENYKKIKIDFFSRNFICIISHNNRLFLLPMILKEFDYFFSLHMNVVKIEVTSIKRLNCDQLDQLTNMMAKKLLKKVYVVNKIDKKILGGIIIRVGDYVVDGSLQGRLLRLNHVLQS